MSMPPPPPPGDQPPPYGASTPLGPQPYGSTPPGYAPYGQSFTPGPAQPGNSGMAVAGFILSLIALVPCFWFVIQLPGLLGLIFSILGLKATKDGMRKGRGLAKAGLVISIIAIALTAVLTTVVLTSDKCVRTDTSFECNFD